MTSPNFLSLDQQELRYLGHPEHLAAMKQLGTTSKIVVVHGVDDTTCPFADAERLAAYYPRTAHAFPPDARERAFGFLDRYLKGNDER